MSPDPRFQVIPLAEVPINPLIGAVPEQRPIVLVVDDEKVIADTLSVILSRSGFMTMKAYDGESALELAKAVPPDLLLSDVMLGSGMDGAELAIAVVQHFPSCKVLLFSGHATSKDLLEKSRQNGHPFTLLTKPLHPADLLERIKGSLALRNTANGAGTAHF
jgi:CheY-like chemotaxis protein